MLSTADSNRFQHWNMLSTADSNNFQHQNMLLTAISSTIETRYLLLEICVYLCTLFFNLSRTLLIIIHSKIKTGFLLLILKHLLLIAISFNIETYYLGLLLLIATHSNIKACYLLLIAIRSNIETCYLLLIAISSTSKHAIYCW